MITHVAVVPQAPLLVPRLSPGTEPGLASLRDACLSAVRTLGARWVAVGPHPEDLTVPPRSAGSFRGYGADVPVRLSADGSGEEPESGLPLPALVAGWLREQTGAESVAVRLLGDATEPAGCARVGEDLDEDGPSALLVLGDGSNRHGAGAPGSADERAAGFDDSVAKALAKADAEALLALDPGLAAELGASGRAAWQVLAGLGDGWRAELLYSAAPFGVAYHVAVWERG
ncbi:class III extradiol dioxygenase subunit B-like domain-containing protein [Amycolatopsis cynarae]|uniref:Class III extradiol dioxygenase subunit B-like domain-containing protein n=1 Tax=Amycolatopsis cynarae TaxID=2995223 RepID=A0ABY7B531_9PSEU|nr:class III extradiol dioxygenase subunit B-like domain-containing protein [Amycolatopsis sp. HUAS 11-8]WAL67410.1 class III extradiol dioxygenase subunit B-like domain-containing protein [Amycolatopsis sp. HUAS 11-8]